MHVSAMGVTEIFNSNNNAIFYRNCGGNWGTFAGDRCEYLSCYKDEFSKPCRYLKTYHERSPTKNVLLDITIVAMVHVCR